MAPRKDGSNSKLPTNQNLKPKKMKRQHNSVTLKGEPIRRFSDDYPVTDIQPEYPNPSSRSTDVTGFHDIENLKLQKFTHPVSELPSKINAAIQRFDKNLELVNLTLAGSLRSFSTEPEDASFKTHCISGQRTVDELRYKGVKVILVPIRNITCDGPDCNANIRVFHKLQGSRQENQTKFSRVKDLADAILERRMKMHAYDYLAPGIIYFGSGDQDYAESLQFLKEKGFVILLSYGPMGGLPLREHVRSSWLWDDMMEGNGPELFSPPSP